MERRYESKALALFIRNEEKGERVRFEPFYSPN